MAEVKITGPDGKTDKLTGTYDEKTRTATGEGRKIYASQHDRVEVSGCFVATEVYGDEYHPEVIILREFRDKVIIPYGIIGRIFVSSYYKIGPYLSQLIKTFPLFKPAVRKFLDIIT